MTQSSDPAFWAGQLRRIETQFLAGPLHYTGIEELTRTAERNFRLPSIAMYRDHDLALVPLMMLSMINAAALLHEPRSECSAFHRWPPAGD
jgi:hypothetical protein